MTSASALRPTWGRSYPIWHTRLLTDPDQDKVFSRSRAAALKFPISVGEPWSFDYVTAGLRSSTFPARMNGTLYIGEYDGINRLLVSSAGVAATESPL